MRLRHRLFVRVLAVLLIALAASPFTAPFSAHHACEAQYKDAAGEKIAGDVALLPILPFAAPPARLRAAAFDCAVERGSRHRRPPTVLRL